MNNLLVFKEKALFLLMHCDHKMTMINGEKVHLIKGLSKRFKC